MSQNEIVKMMVDLAHNKTANFSADSVNEKVRQKLIGILGTDKVDYKALRKNGADIFEILEEAIDILVVEGIEDQFSDFVEIKNTGWGDKPEFTVPSNKLFKVATIANGNADLIRQRLDGGVFTVSTGVKGVKIYDEFYRFLAGRIDWVEMVNRVAKSYNAQIAADIYAAVYASFDILTATYGISGAFVETTMNTLIEHVETKTGMDATLMGTKSSLAKVTTAVVSEKLKENINQLGYYGVFNGTQMRMVKQAHTPGTDTFAINDSFVIVTPEPHDKMIKLVIEGDAIIQEVQGGTNAAMQPEYMFQKSSGIAVVPSQTFGIYRFA